MTLSISEVHQRWRLLLLIAIAVVAGSCHSSCPPGCSEPKSVTTSQMATQQSTSSGATANQLVVYLDTSASMAGYVGSNREKETRLSRSLQELRNFVTLI